MLKNPTENSRKTEKTTKRAPKSKRFVASVPKNRKNSGAVSATMVPSLSMAELQALTHAGTDEAIRTLESYLEREEDLNRRMLLDMALSECSFLRYQPENEREEEDLLLRLVISNHIRQSDETVLRLDKLYDELDRYVIEKKVSERLAKKNIGEDSGKWDLMAIEDMIASAKGQIADAEALLDYEEKWIKEAQSMIEMEKYRDMPERALGFFGGDVDEDDECDCGLCD